ncbi:hybrid sensor histidine kinase/response regulator [Burkholderia pyrrocinia]|uniref:hybrid sensor histidine kinase/response regulator n=1 Tax=Burkholderia pyrrocinia TaxID=60550 RepID=UPI001047AF96|nr:hybrid sensor histidine kinase/response regulator [Burkholderia pyrrocinia]TDA47887.1 response regulator [Burkholderia pyrrocinia]
MSSVQRPSALNQLRRYQRWLTVGGGLLVTALVLLAFALESASALRGHLVSEREAFLVDRNLVMGEIDASETSFRNGLISAEMAWRDRPLADPGMLGQFRDGGHELVMQPFSGARTLLAFGVPSDPPSDDEVRRFLWLATELARRSTASALLRGRPMSGYFFNAQQDLAALIPAPLAGDKQMAATVGDRRALMTSLTAGLEDLTTMPQPLARKPFIRWMPPSTNPLTGRTVVRLAGPGFDDGRPFAVMVTEYEPQAFTAPLAVGRFQGTFMIVGRDGRLIASASQQDEDAGLIERVLAAGAIAGPDGMQEGWSKGIYTIRDRLGDTEWTLVYALPWRVVASGVGGKIATSAVMALSIVVVLWALLHYLNGHIFRRAFERSQRVFDSEHLSRTLIETAPVGLGLISVATGKSLLCSPVMRATAERVVVDAPTLSAEFVRRTRRGGLTLDGRVVREDLTLPTGDGGVIDLSVRVAAARYRGADVLVTAFTDETERRRLEQGLRDAKLAADSANAAKSAFLATMSHEIRTPLNAILGNLELLAHSPLDARQRERLGTVRTASDGLLSIISDVLDFSKIEAGEMTVEQIEFDAFAVASRALSIFAPAARAKRVRLFGRYDGGPRLTVRGDPVRLGQVINNLLSNAIKFTAHGKVTLRIGEYPANGRDGARELVVSVEDTGIGMTTSQQANLFRAFSQADVSINRRFGGTGLGLALCHRLMEVMGGSIVVDSEPARGSRFSIRLPFDAHNVFAGDVGRLPKFDNEPVLFVAADSEWHDYAVPLLREWGLDVAAYRHPGQIGDAALESALTLIVCGARDTWRADDERRLVEESIWVIDCRDDGPMRPVRSGRMLDVSCYTPQGLDDALRYTLLGDEQSAEQVDGDQAADQRPHLGLRVLVAEDNPVNRQLFAEQLTMLGCEATVAADGHAALDALAAQAFDLLLTDLAMSGMDGYALAEHVRARWPAIRIVAVTANATLEERARCFAAGMAAVATKPLSLDALSRALAEDPGWPPAVAPTTAWRAGRVRPLGGKPMPGHIRNTFSTTCEHAREAIRAARDAGDIASVLAELHSLKGALAVFGHGSLVKLCVDLEARVADRPMRDLADAFEALDRALAELSSCNA